MDSQVRLIDANALIQKAINDSSEAFAQGTLLVKLADVLNAPTVDPVKHGMWVGEGDGYADGEMVFDVWHCSNCDYCIDEGVIDPDSLPNYCPVCGAKMDGGDGHE